MSDVGAVDDLMGELNFSPTALKSKYLEERDKRIRTDGNDQYIEVTAEFSHYVDLSVRHAGCSLNALTRSLAAAPPLRWQRVAIVELIDVYDVYRA